MSTVNRFSAEPFTNEFGQVINPGDPVIYAGSAWKSTRIRKAVFEGVYYGKNWRDEGETIQAVRCGNIPTKKFVWDEPYDRNKKDQKWHYEAGERKAILPLKRVYKLDTAFEQFDGKSF